MGNTFFREETVVEREARAQRAADSLSTEMFMRLNVDVAPDKLAVWLQERWHLVSPLAHAIHRK